MENVARYWLNRGFDGMRLDAVRYLVEEPSAWRDTAESHAWFRSLYADVPVAYDRQGYRKFMVGEAWINGDDALRNAYYGSVRPNRNFQMLFRL
jgi:alpha-glucosidase